MTCTHRAFVIAAIALGVTACAVDSATPTERSAASIRDVVRGHTSEVEACYESHLAEDPNAAGTVVASFAISPAGEVTSPSLELDGLESPDLEACLVEAIGSWTFDEIEGVEATTVRYPFTFRPSPERGSEASSAADREL